MLQQCPTCSAVIDFSHPETNVIQCRCFTIVERSDTNINPNQSYYAVEDTFEVIAPGTTGEFKGRRFTVLGRFRAWIEEFVINYWTIVFEDRQLGFLGEGYGLYSIYKPLKIKEAVLSPGFRNESIDGKRRLIDNREFIIERKFSCSKVEIEGETLLPFFAKEFKTLECAAEDGQRIEVMEFKGGHVGAFDVTYTTYNELNFKKTRPYRNKVKIIECKNCSASFEVITYPFAQSFVCNKCDARYSLQKTVSIRLENSKNKVEPVPDIKIGAEGIITDIRYKVIGFAIKQENRDENAQWREYTLWNEVEGFAFLSEYNGHWLYVRECGDAPVLKYETAESMMFNGKTFLLFNSYNYFLVYAAGEFPHNIFNDNDKNAREFIYPPEMWIREKDEQEGISWFNGEYISNKKLEIAFGDNITLPPQIGIGAAQPTGYLSGSRLFFAYCVGALLLFLTHLLTSFTNDQREILNRQFSFNDSMATVSYVSPVYHFDKWKSAVRFEIYAPVLNDWFELEATLVEKNTGTEYSLSKGVEYYQGYTDGENWSEGSTTEDAYLSSIPAGDYTLQLQGTRAALPSGPGYITHFTVKVTYDVSIDWNLYVCLGLLLIWPIWRFILDSLNEKKRWSNSPFAEDED